MSYSTIHLLFLVELFKGNKGDDSFLSLRNVDIGDDSRLFLFKWANSSEVEVVASVLIEGEGTRPVGSGPRLIQVESTIIVYNVHFILNALLMFSYILPSEHHTSSLE